MARGVEDVEPYAFNLDAIALRDPHRYDVGLGLLAHHRDAMRAIAECAEPGNVIGVQMGVDSFYELQVELAYELQITLHLFQNRIDNQRLAARPAGEDIGVSYGGVVEELAEDHALTFVSTIPSIMKRRKE